MLRPWMLFIAKASRAFKAAKTGKAAAATTAVTAAATVAAFVRFILYPIKWEQRPLRGCRWHVRQPEGRQPDDVRRK